jgi:L-histidine Nalpha-methyltransferase
MNIALKSDALVVDDFLTDVLAGLSGRQKTLSPRWLYDQTGSELFEQITELPEYYVTRTEVSILSRIAPVFAAKIGAGATIVEYGAGAALKVRFLLDALDAPKEYVAIDISHDHLAEAVKPIASDYEGLSVRPVAGNFLINPPALDLPATGARVGFFPGSTIGNLSNREIDDFLCGVRSQLGVGSYLVLGADLRKSLDVLIPAYDDMAGVTARFDKNLLVRINRELGGTFEVDQFAHRAIWNDKDSRIEMHLEALGDMDFAVAGREFSMISGETIHTENSRKFGQQKLRELARASGWEMADYATDDRGYFAVILLQAR